MMFCLRFEPQHKYSIHFSFFFWLCQHPAKYYVPIFSGKNIQNFIRPLPLPYSTKQPPHATKRDLARKD